MFNLCSSFSNFLIIFVQFSLVLALVAADSYKAPIPILKDDRSQNSYGEYSFSFETGNGIARSEEGKQADGQENSGKWS